MSLGNHLILDKLSRKIKKWSDVSIAQATCVFDFRHWLEILLTVLT